MPRVLLVEDTADMAKMLRDALELEGYDVEWAPDGERGLERVREWDPALLLLDVTLPGMDGYRVLRALRDERRMLPVLLLSALAEEVNKVRGFRLGADDYVTKPFGLLELLARVEALLRRSTANAAAEAPGVERFGAVEVDPQTRTVRRAGAEVPLTPREFDLLLALLQRRGALVSRLDLLREVWGYRYAVMSRTVDSHVAELRRKLEDDPATPRHILTVRKVGYRLRE